MFVGNFLVVFLSFTFKEIFFFFFFHFHFLFTSVSVNTLDRLYKCNGLQIIMKEMHIRNKILLAQAYLVTKKIY